MLRFPGPELPFEEVFAEYNEADMTSVHTRVISLQGSLEIRGRGLSKPFRVYAVVRNYSCERWAEHWVNSVQSLGQSLPSNRSKAKLSKVQCSLR